MNHCLKCGIKIDSVCPRCSLPYEKSWIAGLRDKRFERLTDGLKYKSIRALAYPMAEMLSASLPNLEEDVVVVPVPTIARHVRERGLDHTLLLGKSLAKLRGWKCVKLVRRVTSTVQVGANREQRLAQAEKAYELAGEVDKHKSYLVLDDVSTTGASIVEVCRVLRKGGAKKVYATAFVKAKG